jgi:hypothetical protein
VTLSIVIVARNRPLSDVSASGWRPSSATSHSNRISQFHCRRTRLSQVGEWLFPHQTSRWSNSWRRRVQMHLARKPQLGTTPKGCRGWTTRVSCPEHRVFSTIEQLRPLFCSCTVLSRCRHSLSRTTPTLPTCFSPILSLYSDPTEVFGLSNGRGRKEFAARDHGPEAVSVSSGASIDYLQAPAKR